MTISWYYSAFLKGFMNKFLNYLFVRLLSFMKFLELVQPFETLLTSKAMKWSRKAI